SPDFPTNRFLCWLGGLLNAPELCTNNVHLNVINTRMGGQFSLHMMVSLVTGIVVAVPFLLWELWRFVKPAFSYYEQRKSNLFVLYVSSCFFFGLAFGYFVIAPLTVNFLSGYEASALITNMIDVNSYITTVINVSMASAAVFQLPILVYFLSKMGIVTAAFMRKYRKHAIVVLAILAAIITPPDIFSCVLVLLPMMGLYELSINIAKRNERKRREDEAAFYGDLPEESNKPIPVSAQEVTVPEGEPDQSYYDYYHNPDENRND
ncbi:MAG: twin-arginine translocase subunit TatC, partial [Rikenellaceae bacterium]|nr:twin-arginine translocase subunit TatC [Rikenellaceae bacterium]